MAEAHRVFVEFLLVGPVTTTQNSSVSLLFHFTVLISPLQTLTSLNKSVEGSDIRNAGRQQATLPQCKRFISPLYPLASCPRNYLQSNKKETESSVLQKRTLSVSHKSFEDKVRLFQVEELCKINFVCISFAQQVKYSFLNVHSCSTLRHPPHWLSVNVLL